MGLYDDPFGVGAMGGYVPPMNGLMPLPPAPTIPEGPGGMGQGSTFQLPQAPQPQPPYQPKSIAPVAPQVAPQAPQVTQGLPKPPAPAPAPAAPQGAPDGGPQGQTGLSRYDRLLMGIMPAESGGNPNAKNPLPGSTASGALQILDPTFQDFLKSPANTAGYTMADKNKTPVQMAAGRWYLAHTDDEFNHRLGRPASDNELQASWMFGPVGAAALAANPTANAYDVLRSLDPKTVDKVFDQNQSTGLKRSMSAGDALQTVATYYQNKVGGSGAPGAGTQVADAGNVKTDAALGGPSRQNQFDPSATTPFSSPYPNAYQRRPGADLLALASGLLAGPNFGQGLSKGLQAMIGVQQQDREAEMKANTEAAQLYRLGIDDKYRNALIKQMGVKADQKDTSLGIDQQKANNGTASVDVRRQAIQNQQQAILARLDPAVAARLSQSKTAAVDAEKDINGIMQAQPSDQAALADVDEALKLSRDNPQFQGPTLLARGQRALTEMGIIGNASDLQALQKAETDQRNRMLQSLTGGHVGGIRSNAELTNLSKAVADVSTSPAAAQWIMQMQKRQLEATQAWREEYAQRLQDDPDTITGRQYAVTKSKFFSDYNADHPMPAYNPAGQSAPASTPAPAPAAGTAPSGVVKGVSNGVQWQFTPSQ